MSRTEDLKGGGARQVGGVGGSAPFVKWTDDYAWLEGKITGFWEGEYGRVARVVVSNTSGNLEGQMGAGEARQTINAGDEVNLGLGSAALDCITDDFHGSTVHVAFIEWGTTKAGQQFRSFDVLEIEAGAQHAPPSERDDSRPPDPAPSDSAGPRDAGVKDDDIPF